MPVPSLSAALRRVQKAEAMVRARSDADRVRVDLRGCGEPMPEWPDKRPDDVWIVLDVPDTDGNLPEVALPPDGVTRYYRPPATVASFQASAARARCIVGPIGSGKSSGCVAELMRRACEQRPGPDGVRRTRFAIIRNTYSQLRDTTRKTWEEWCPTQLGTWRETDFTFMMSFGDVRSEIMFRSLDRPNDIKKLLSLELTGAYVNEARELSKDIFDALTGRVGRYPSMAAGGASWRGVFMDTNPWHPGFWADKLFNKSGDPRFKLYRQPGGRSPDGENRENLDPDYYRDLIAGKSAEWVKVYIDSEDATGAIGSVYGPLLSKLRERGGLCDFPHGTDEVFVAWDIGVSDATAILWYRFNENGGVDIIDWHEDNGKGFSKYAAIVEAKPYQIATHFFPHDARVTSWQTGKTALQVALERWPGKVRITPRADIEEGIEVTRWLLEQPTTRIHSRCDVVPPDREFSGVQLLGEYRYQFDEANKVFSKTPLHNFASHTSDCARYLACAVKASGFLIRKDPEPPPPHPDLGPQPWRLDELFEEYDEYMESRPRKRI